MLPRSKQLLSKNRFLNRITVVGMLLTAVILSLTAFVWGLTSVQAVTAEGDAAQSGASPAVVTVTETSYLPLVLNRYPPTFPIIVSFTAQPNPVVVGEGVSLTWGIQNTVDTLTLTPGVGDVTGLIGVVVTPTDSTVFTLLATNADGSSSEDLSVTVIQPPVIADFSADMATIDAGDSTTLNWTIENGTDSLTIVPDVGDVTGMSSVPITPTQTTTYTLTAVNAAGTVNAETTVTVNPTAAPIINSFTATDMTINQGDSTTLNWSIANNPDSVTITPGVGDVTGQSSKNVSPNSTTTYTIEATNGSGSDSAQITITVIEPPIIDTFTASPNTINQGQSSTLSWTVSNDVDSLSINQGVGSVTGQSSTSVSPSSTTTYRLTATNSAGSDTKQVTVNVNSGGSGNELLIFDWNGPVTKADRGFPWDKPPMENGNWVSPINYADGTLHFRVEIFNQGNVNNPTPQADMQLQFCIWQTLSTPNDRETCGVLHDVPGFSGTVVDEWSTSIPDPSTYKKNNLPLDWTRPRLKNGVAIKNGAGTPVSDFCDSEGNCFNWGGEDPDQWYPLDMRFTVVVVEAGKTFSGWENYIP